MVTDETLRTRVDRGAKFLDKVMPFWYEKINTNTLNMHSNTHCIIGQLSGDYGFGLYEYFEKADPIPVVEDPNLTQESNLLRFSVGHGFTMYPVSYGSVLVNYQFGQLAGYWTEEIYVRLEKARRQGCSAS